MGILITLERLSQFTSLFKNWVINSAGKLNKPSTDGSSGQLLITNGDGTTDWVSAAPPSDSQINAAVATWMAAHPNAYTTVQDGSITADKLSTSLKVILQEAVRVDADNKTLYIDTIYVGNSIDIVTQPQDVDYVAGEPATFTVEALGYNHASEAYSPQDLSYQWQTIDTSTNTWVNISGATSNTYSFTPVGNGPDAFRCVLTNILNGDSKVTNTVYGEGEPTSEDDPDPTEEEIIDTPVPGDITDNPTPVDNPDNPS